MWQISSKKKMLVVTTRNVVVEPTNVMKSCIEMMNSQENGFDAKKYLNYLLVGIVQ